MSAHKIEETIKEIAVTHGVALDQDDPILILQTLNERLLRDSAAAQQEILDRFQDELEGISKRWSNEAKDKAERILNAALAASRETMQEGAVTAGEAVAARTHEAMAGMASRLARVATLNLIASGMAVFAASMAFWAIL